MVDFCSFAERLGKVHMMPTQSAHSGTLCVSARIASVASGKAWFVPWRCNKSNEREKSIQPAPSAWSPWRPSGESRVHTHGADAGMMVVLSHGPIKARNGLWRLAF